MTTNSFTIDGIVTLETKVDGKDITNKYILAAKDSDDIFYILLMNPDNVIAWGSYNTDLNKEPFQIFGTSAVSDDSTISPFLLSGTIDSTLKGYSTVEDSGGLALGPSSTATALTFTPTVTVEKDKIFTGVWYKVFHKGTQDQYGGKCFQPIMTKGKWRGIKPGETEFKSLLFTFIPVNNFIITGDLQTCTSNPEPISLSAFNIWKDWSESTTVPNCLGSSLGKNCVFTIQSVTGKQQTCTDLFGWSYSQTEACGGTTYSSCATGVCVPVGGAMSCSMVRDENLDEKSKGSWVIYLILIIVIALLGFLFVAMKNHRSV